MSSPSPAYRYAYISCPEVTLRVVDSSSFLFRMDVTLLGRYSPPNGEEVLLVRQLGEPRLVQLPAAATNLAALGELPVFDDQRLVPTKLFEALQLLEDVQLRSTQARVGADAGFAGDDQLET
ncbi:hypothetical protein ACFFLM_06665 [Deinococcus oregonensis]|uniref:Uncharacterized protein n=1 Tax=Deinococcus oregonensis TaxID=1805970 RepID=A0ABV6AVW3_9DEIO